MKFFRYLLSTFDLDFSGKMLLCSVLVGVVAGFGAIAFHAGIEYVQDHCEKYTGVEALEEGTHIETLTEAIRPQLSTNWQWLFLLPAAGGLLCGVLVYTLAPEAEGHGTDGMIRAFHQQRGEVRTRVPIIKAVASILTIGTGGSAGREGPTAQIGAGFGSFLATRLDLRDQERRILLLAGAAGGVGAIFHAPIGGALFAVEVLYASAAFEFAALIPCLFASITAHVVYTSIMGPDRVLAAPAGQLYSGLHEVPYYIIFALLCVFVAFFYVRTFYGMRDKVFRKIKMPPHFKPAIGGLAVGLIAIFLPQILAGGYNLMQSVLDHGDQLTGLGGSELLTLAAMLLLLALVKVVATSLTISSGGSGGVYAPSLFVGAMLGGSFAFFVNGASVSLGFEPPLAHPAAFVLVGMGGFFAGVAKVPLTALVMTSEICGGSYELFMPLMIVCTICVGLISRRCTLYEEQVDSQLDSPAHLGDFVVDLLENITVSEVYKPDRTPVFIREETSFEEIVKIVASVKSSYFPVIDAAEDLVGIFTLEDIRIVLISDTDARRLICAADIAVSPVQTVTPEDDLHTVLRICSEYSLTQVPVVEKENPKKVICMLHRGEVISAYDRKLHEYQSD